MANLLTVEIVDDLPRFKRSSLTEASVGGFEEGRTTVSSGGQTDFNAPSGATITSTNTLEFERNGQRLYEGVTNDYTRDSGNNKIVTNYSIPEGSEIRFRVYAG